MSVPTCPQDFRKRPLAVEKDDNATPAQPEELQSRVSASVVKMVKKKAKRVQFVDYESARPLFQETSASTSIAVTHVSAQLTTPLINLLQTKNFCHYLKQNRKLCNKAVLDHCVGYLDYSQVHRYNFYLQDKHLSPESNSNSGAGNAAVFSVFDLMDQADT